MNEVPIMMTIIRAVGMAIAVKLVSEVLVTTFKIVEISRQASVRSAAFHCLMKIACGLCKFFSVSSRMRMFGQMMTKSIEVPRRVVHLVCRYGDPFLAPVCPVIGKSSGRKRYDRNQNESGAGY
jgi:hypothetical protein